MPRTVTDADAPDPTPGAAPPRRSDARLREVVVIAVTTLVIVAGVVVVHAARGGGAVAAPSASAVASLAGANGSAKGAAPKVGAPAPDFVTLTTTGDELVLSDLKGKPVWLVFGATWCPDCRAEAPDVQTVHKKYGDKVQIVGVYAGETLATVDDYAQRIGLTYPQVADAYDDVASTYRVMGFPTHVFIGPDGKITDIVVGVMTVRDASTHLDAMLRAR